MTMPVDLVLVRHGESEGNVFHGANAHLYAHLSLQFKERHSSTWHLTDRGIKQAELSGALLRQHFAGPPHFDRYFTSDYLRAIETSVHLALPGAAWRRSPFVVERDWGDLEGASREDRLGKFAEAMARHEREGMWWRPPGGERLIQVALPLLAVLDTLHRECSDKKVVIVCHGEVMHMFRILIERVPPEAYPSWYAMDEASDWRIPNGGIVHYTRRDPATGAEAMYANWTRMIAPNDRTNDIPAWSPWRTIVRKRHTNEELLAIAADYPPRLIS